MCEPRTAGARVRSGPATDDPAADHSGGDAGVTVRTGVDVQSIERFREMDPAVRAALAERVFSDAERDYCEGTGHPAQHYAVRWAATEAFVKLLDDADGVAPDSVAVAREGSGPSLVLGDDARRALAAAIGTTDWVADVSLSHDREADAALAQVVVAATEGGRV